MARPELEGGIALDVFDRSESAAHLALDLLGVEVGPAVLGALAARMAVDGHVDRTPVVATYRRSLVTRVHRISFAKSLPRHDATVFHG